MKIQFLDSFLMRKNCLSSCNYNEGYALSLLEFDNISSKEFTPILTGRGSGWAPVLDIAANNCPEPNAY